MKYDEGKFLPTLLVIEPFNNVKDGFYGGLCHIHFLYFYVFLLSDIV